MRPLWVDWVDLLEMTNLGYCINRLSFYAIILAKTELSLKLLFLNYDFSYENPTTQLCWTLRFCRRQPSLYG